MSVLMFAFGFYILGISLVLFLRPRLMFRDGGWKEFGLRDTEQHTLLPFWMFVIVWAFISYILGSLIMVGFSSIAVEKPTASIIQPISQMATPTEKPPIPGYYIVQPQDVGSPQFIYYGPEPPTLRNLSAYSR